MAQIDIQQIIPVVIGNSGPIGAFSRTQGQSSSVGHHLQVAIGHACEQYIGRQALRDQQILVAIVVQIHPKGRFGLLKNLPNPQVLGREPTLSVVDIREQFSLELGECQVVQIIAVEIHETDALSQKTTDMVGHQRALSIPFHKHLAVHPQGHQKGMAKRQTPCLCRRMHVLKYAEITDCC